VLANETFYSAVIIAIFIFSDATPELNIKFGAGVVLMTSCFLLVFANFLMIIIMIYRGRDRLKEEIKEAKLKRAEKELMEEEEEEERRQRQKKEEEEFTRLPEDTTNMSHYDLTKNTTNPAVMSTQDVLNPKDSKKKKSKKKNKNNNDDLDEIRVGVASTDFATDGKEGKGKKVKDKSKKKRKDKNKNNNDDVEGAPIEEEDVVVDSDKKKSNKGKKTASTDENPAGTSSSDKKGDEKKSKKGKNKG
jgi:hypothetical protein